MFHKIVKTLITRSLFFLIVFCCCLSCKTDLRQVSPDLYFKTIRDGSILWNSVNIELGVTNSGSLSKVDILVNSKVQFTLTQTPFRTDWNTLDLEDGEYEVKAVSTDKDGNQRTAKVTVVIQNTLLSFTVPNNHLRSANGQMEKGWVFISSTSGELLALSEFKNGEKIKLINHGYNEKTFMVSETYLNSGVILDISSFLDVGRGHWTLAKVEESPPVVGRLSINFKDSVGVHPYYVSTSGDARKFYEGGNSIKLNLTQSPSRLFIRELGKDFNHYNLIEGLTFNNPYTGLFAELNNPLQSFITPDIPGAETVGVRLYGFPNASSFSEFYQLGVFVLNQGKVKIEYPGLAFPAYGSETFYRGNNIRINSFHPTKMYDATPLTAQVIFKDVGNTTATLATFGNFDVYLIGWGHVDKESELSWVLTGGQGKSEYLKLPELPPTIRSAASVNFNTKNLQFFNVVQLADYEISSGYQSYIQYISANGYNAPYTFGKGWKEQTFGKDGITGGGRKNADEVPTIKERLSRR